MAENNGDNHHEHWEGEDGDEEDEEDRVGHVRRGRAIEVRRDCPYLDTVNRQINLSMHSSSYISSETFSRGQVGKIDQNRRWSRALDGSDYLTGMGELEVVKDGGTEVGKVIMETSKMPFLMLGLDLPPPSLFKDVMEKNIIPQVPLFNIMKKFDGETVTEVVRPHIARMRYLVTKLPQYIILHTHRFTKNNFFVEKIPSLVNFHMKNLELKDCIPLPAHNEKERMRTKYDLVANIVHEGSILQSFCAAEIRRAMIIIARDAGHSCVGNIAPDGSTF